MSGIGVDRYLAVPADRYLRERARKRALRKRRYWYTLAGLTTLCASFVAGYAYAVRYPGELKWILETFYAAMN